MESTNIDIINKLKQGNIQLLQKLFSLNIDQKGDQGKLTSALVSSPSMAEAVNDIFVNIKRIYLYNDEIGFDSNLLPRPIWFKELPPISLIEKATNSVEEIYLDHIGDKFNAMALEFISYLESIHDECVKVNLSDATKLIVQKSTFLNDVQHQLVIMVDRLRLSQANRQRIENVDSCFGSQGETLWIEGRVLVGEGVLMKMCRKKAKPRQFFLFNDILVYGSILISKKRYHKQRIIPLEQIQLTDLKDEGNVKHGWNIMARGKSFAVYAATETEKQEWILHINRCIQELIRNGKRPENEHAAIWVPDSEAPECMCCFASTFSMINRRHHCRSCGKVVCGNCSQNRYLLPKISNSRKVRVCDICYRKLIDGEDPTITVSSSEGVNKTETTHFETDESDEDDTASDHKTDTPAETTFYESALHNDSNSHPGTSTVL